jgi:hypothetical protein
MMGNTSLRILGFGWDRVYSSVKVKYFMQSYLNIQGEQKFLDRRGTISIKNFQLGQLRPQNIAIPTKKNHFISFSGIARPLRPTVQKI